MSWRTNSFGQPLDRLGRQVPHKLNVLSFVRGVGGFADHLLAVPATHIVDGKPLTVACPCGTPAEVKPLRLTYCAGGCGRIYTSTGSTVFVAYGLAETPESGS